MTQDERWYTQWKEIIDFMEVNKRRPSKFVDEERGMRNWRKHQQKLCPPEPREGGVREAGSESAVKGCKL